jgi:actin related protein 2/3 complex subunit 5
VRQLLRGGDPEGALRGALESAPYGGDAVVKEAHLQTVTEVLQSIKASEMTPMLQRIFGSEGGGEVLDVLMKYLYVPFSLLSSNPVVGKSGLGAIGTCKMGRQFTDHLFLV